MITINELFTNPNDEKVVESINNLETFAEENNLEMADYAGTLDYINLESDEERIDAIEFTIANADDSDYVNMNECDSVENLFYQAITNMSDNVAHTIHSFAEDLIMSARTIEDINPAGQRVISERGMYEISKRSDEIIGALTDVLKSIDNCLECKDKE